MTNHLVGSFTCPLNPIFGSIREQIKYLCCLLEVQGFISLCDCFMQRLGERAILSIRAPGKLISGSVSKSVLPPTALCIRGKKKNDVFFCNKAALNDVSVFAPWKKVRFYKIETAAAAGSKPSEITKFTWILKLSALLPFGVSLPLKLEQHFMSRCCFPSPRGRSLIETLHILNQGVAVMFCFTTSPWSNIHSYHTVCSLLNCPSDVNDITVLHAGI